VSTSDEPVPRAWEGMAATKWRPPTGPHIHSDDFDSITLETSGILLYLFFIQVFFDRFSFFNSVVSTRTPRAAKAQRSVGQTLLEKQRTQGI